MIFEQMAKRLYDQSSFESTVQLVLDDAIALHGAEFGNVQLAARDYLIIAAQRGFKAAFANFFARVRADDGCACGRALRTGRTVVIRDIEADEEYAPYRAAARAAGFRSVMTTPLFTNKKVLIGTVSTHFVNVHTPTAIEIDTLKSYSVAAADHLHNLLGGETVEAKALSMSSRIYAALIN
jgi:GAF domain-containing protein